MAESYIQLPADGAGKKAHTFNRTVGANLIEDEIVLQGQDYRPLYTISHSVASALTATANDHLLQLMAGASLNVYVKRIQIWQGTLAGAATSLNINLLRLTTAGTTPVASITPAPLDSSDPACGATAMVRPSVKGTESTSLRLVPIVVLTAVPTGGGESLKLMDFEFGTNGTKLLRIPAGTANGIALKNTAALATASVTFYVEFFELNF